MVSIDGWCRQLPTTGTGTCWESLNHGHGWSTVAAWRLCPAKLQLTRRHTTHGRPRFLTTKNFNLPTYELWIVIVHTSCLSMMFLEGTVSQLLMGIVVTNEYQWLAAQEVRNIFEYANFTAAQARLAMVVCDRSCYSRCSISQRLWCVLLFTALAFAEASRYTCTSAKILDALPPKGNKNYFHLGSIMFLCFKDLVICCCPGGIGRCETLEDL